MSTFTIVILVVGIFAVARVALRKQDREPNDEKLGEGGNSGTDVKGNQK